jgi:thiamine-monophosphate kinase
VSVNLPLGPGAEFDAIREMLARWGDRATGIGDDAAVLELPRGDKLVVSTDTAIENRHFKTRWLTPQDIGYRAVAAALSDLAAMAAAPVGVLVAIGAPESWRAKLGEIAEGIGSALDVAKTRIVGGNMSDADILSITTTVIGRAYSPLGRDGARRGDHLYVTGRLGGPDAALRRLESGEPAGVFHARFARPEPRIEEAQWLAERGASSCIDISDGLVADARHLASASGRALEIDSDRVPCIPGVAVELALESGEEYELLVTSRRDLDPIAFEAHFRVPLTRIGRVVDGPAGAVRVLGALVANPRGHDHFSS